MYLPYSIQKDKISIIQEILINFKVEDIRERFKNKQFHG